MLIAHDLIGYDPSLHPPAFRFSENTVIGQVLLQTLMSLFSQLDRTTRAEAPVVARALIALLQAILFAEPGGELQSPGFVDARVRTIRAHIDQNLRSGTLGTETICRQFSVSRATLYRDFKDAGGIERYIQERRLDAALSSLANGLADRGAVTRAAEQWGFSSTSHFSREFRRRFGIAPSDLVGQRRHLEAGRRAGDKTDFSGDLERFLRKL